MTTFRQSMIAVDVQQLGGTGRYIVISVGKSGFCVMNFAYPDLESLDLYVGRLQTAAGKAPYITPSTAERTAALYGAIFGWDCPLARPDAYTAAGEPLKRTERPA